MTDPRAGRVLRRSGPFLAIGIVLLVLAVPASFDLRRLFLWAGLLAILLGVVSALFNWFDRSTADSPSPVRSDEQAGDGRRG